MQRKHPVLRRGLFEMRPLLGVEKSWLSKKLTSLR